MNLYEQKRDEYFLNIRRDLVSFIPQNPDNRILEIGAGGGDTLVHIKKAGLAREVMGIELFEMPGTQQKNPSIDKFVVGNIETMSIEAPLNYFDVILCGDVLEHLINPWVVGDKLIPHLKVNGLFVISVPNFREMLNLYTIFFRADFRYESEGIRDKTHLRFFCRKNILELVSRPNLQVVEHCPSFTKTVKGQWQYKRKIINKFTFGVFKDLFAAQYLVVAKRTA
jgi:2-polyprenyl-3-methyl-5-hydroxy-6-metoxy-1,4-benzoquinol methylase